MADRYAAAHARVKELDWKASYYPTESAFKTKYKIPKRTKDPFKTLIRQYCAMEKEKDDRAYGGISDVVTRMGTIRNADPKWVEAQKTVLSVLTLGEYSAAKTMSLLIDSVDNDELRQGYMVQMMDEVRHYNQEAWLLRYWSKNWSDTEGFSYAMKHRAQNLFFRAGRAAFECNMSEDPIASCLSLQLIAETAYTNPVFIAMTENAQRNGDFATPSIFLSIQSDEARHMANGYATLAAVLSEPDNLPMLQQDLDDMWWRTARFFDPFVGNVYDYFQSNPVKSYAEVWDEWIWEDWGGTYMAQLEPFGLKPPSTLEYSRELSRTGNHCAEIFQLGAWPLMFYRMQGPKEPEYEFLENKYPGWYAKYGAFWENYHKMTDPADGTLALSMFTSQGPLPPICRVCQVPAIMPDLHTATPVFAEKAHGWEAFCSTQCEAIFDRNPIRFMQYTPFFEAYDGWDLADIVIDQGLIRKDGKTLLAQPTLDMDKMWTIDDIRRAKVVIENPVRLHAEKVAAERKLVGANTGADHG